MPPQMSASFRSHRWITTRATVCSIQVNIGDFRPMWPWNLRDVLKKTIGNLVYATSSLVNHSVVFCEFKLKLRSGNAKIGAKFVLTSVTLILDFWPWPFAWTSLLLMVISLANSMMIGWGKHCKRVWRTDGQTDKQIDGTAHWAAWSLQKKKRIGSEDIIQNAAMVFFYIFRMIQELIIRWIDSFVVCLHAPFF